MDISIDYSYFRHLFGCYSLYRYNMYYRSIPMTRSPEQKEPIPADFLLHDVTYTNSLTP